MRLRLPDPLPMWLGGGLRPWSEADAERLVAAWNDAEIRRWNPIPDEPSTERARRWIAGWPARLEANRALDLCIVDHSAPADATRPEPTVVGEVGLSGIDTERRAAMIGYWLLPDGRGRGLASSAVAALCDFTLGELGARLIVARCATANAASQRVAEHAGFTYARRDGAGHELWTRRRVTGSDLGPYGFSGAAGPGDPPDGHPPT